MNIEEDWKSRVCILSPDSYIICCNNSSAVFCQHILLQFFSISIKMIHFAIL